MKLTITGASVFTNRLYEACGPYQWARELLINALEAGASKVDFGVVPYCGNACRAVYDDGEGMSRAELVAFFGTLGVGSKRIGDVHDNFGVGAKVATLPWNPNGVVVLSYKGGVGNLIWMVLDDATGDYELVEFSTGSGTTASAINPDTHRIEGLDINTIRPHWMTDHGTCVLLLGSEAHPNTAVGNPDAGERDLKGLSSYLNTRFWDLTGYDIQVTELRSTTTQETSRRKITGARYYLEDVESTSGRLAHRGSLKLAKGCVDAAWWLWEGERPHIHSYARRPGYIAIKYKNELHHVTNSKLDFRNFGVVESKVQQNLTIVLEPRPLAAGPDGDWGVYHDQSRTRLLFTDSNGRGQNIPLFDWGREFAENIPAPILDAVTDARGETSGTIESEEYRKRLQDKFGNRWRVRRLVLAPAGDGDTPAGARDDEIPVEVSAHQSGAIREDGHRNNKPMRKSVIRRVATPVGNETAVEGFEPVDVPHYRYTRADAFARPWHLAAWAPNDVGGPAVLINTDSHILRDIIKYHQANYPDIFADEVSETVRAVFGEVAACKVAHSQKLAALVPEEQLNRDYRSEEALTLGLMGLLAEDAVIAARLGHKLGRKQAG